MTQALGSSSINCRVKKTETRNAMVLYNLALKVTSTIWIVRSNTLPFTENKIGQRRSLFSSCKLMSFSQEERDSLIQINIAPDIGILPRTRYCKLGAGANGDPHICFFVTLTSILVFNLTNERNTAFGFQTSYVRLKGTKHLHLR